MGKANNNGQMDLFMMENGNQIYNKEKENLFILMVKFMMVNSFKAKQKVKGNTLIKMVQHMLEPGQIINITAEVQKTGKEIYTTGNINTVKNMEKANLFGQMVLNMMVICLKMIFKEKELISGLMVENTRVIGQQIKCMDRVFFYGEMEKYTKENILKVKRKDMANFNGATVKFIKDNGKMDFNMGKE